MTSPETEPSYFDEVRGLWSRRKRIWDLIKHANRLRFWGLPILVTHAAVETGIALLVGKLFDKVTGFGGRPVTEWRRFVILALVALASAYVLKESLQLARRWIIARVTTQIERETTVRLVS